MCIRAPSIVYLGIFAMLRFLLNRQVGGVGISDLLLLVLIADAAQNAMAADYRSLSDGFVLIGTLVFWAYFLDWLAYHVPAVQRVVVAPPLPLVKDGRMIRRNMKRELLTDGELLSEMRLQGCDDLKKVREARMESDGRISFVMQDAEQSRDARDSRSGTA